MPSQGGTVSGVVSNFGWALTPGTAKIPTDGSTMTVAVDGVALATVDYNHCRAGASPTPAPGTCPDDISTLFPNFTNIKTASGGIGVRSIDTTTLANGLHTIVWAVTDDQGRADGIGSRFFNVLNGSSLTASGSSSQTTTPTASSTASSLETALAAPLTSLGPTADFAWRLDRADVRMIERSDGLPAFAPLRTAR